MLFQPPSNAVKFVDPGISAQVRIWAKPVTLHGQPATRVHVQDNGIGIAPGQQEQIFIMFQWLHSQERYPGTGIGLAIVRKSVERLAGRVGVESEPGKGSCFWVELALPIA